MKRKVAAPDIEIGMYVVELDRPWVQAPFETPFEIQGFTIYTDEELEKIRRLCRFVYIDTVLGKGAQRYLPDRRSLKELVDVVNILPASSIPSPAYPENTPLGEELSTAQQVLEDTDRLYNKVVNDIQEGNAVDAEEVKSVVNALVESVVRNPAAAAWLVRLKKRDQTTYAHSISVAVLVLAMGRFLGLPKGNLQVIGTSGLLQDIGKIQIPPQLLEKSARLTFQEREFLKKHVRASVQMLQSAGEFPADVIQTVTMHHERHDGSGYPSGLFSGDITLAATICGMVDSYEAMINHRPYRRPKTSFEALMELYDERDSAFPGAMIEQFIQCVGIFPIGSFVQLNTKEVGVVVQRNQMQQLRPKVLLMVDADGKRLKDPRTVDLGAQYLEPGKVPRVVSRVVDAKRFDLDPKDFFV